MKLTLLTLTLFFAANSQVQATGEELKTVARSMAREKEIAEFDAAVSRLALFDLERAEFISDTLNAVKYPVDFETIRTKLGGKDALVWCCSSSAVGQKETVKTDIFAVAKPDSQQNRYVIVVDYEKSPLGQSSTTVIRARLCYEPSIGGRFVFEFFRDKKHPLYDDLQKP